MARVVCGYDGSDPSHTALRWALDEARMRGGDLTVVTVVPRLERGAGPYGFEVRDPRLDQRQLEAAQGSAHEAVEQVRGELGVGEDVPVRVTGVLGVPAEEIMAQADGADLIVVGSRGVGGFQRLLLGSVSTALVHHSTSPVLVVRTPAAS